MPSITYLTFGNITEEGKPLVDRKLEVLGFPDCSFVPAAGHQGKLQWRTLGKEKEKGREWKRKRE